MIQLKNLSFGYNKKRLLYKDVSLTLGQGSIYGLLGKNGAGKSTLLKNMAGLLFPVSGQVVVNGFEPRQRLPSFLETIYLIPEEVHVPALSIQRYKDLFAPFYPRFDEAAFMSYLEQLDVKDKGKLNRLSFGQQKKFVIAFALACNTKVLLLDEPTNGLDIPSKIRFRKLISSVFAEDRMIFISTHQIRDLDNLIDRVVIVDDGQLLLHASIAEISARLSFKVVPEVINADEVLYSEDALNGFRVVKTNTDGGESKVNLEHLFNAVTDNPQKAKALFNQ